MRRIRMLSSCDGRYKVTVITTVRDFWSNGVIIHERITNSPTLMSSGMNFRIGL